MKLAEIQALRPADGADSASVAAAVEKATTARRTAVERQEAAEAARADSLSNDDRALKAAAADADAARFTVERLDALLPLLRGDLARAKGRETLEELREQARALEPLAGRVRQWQRDTYPQLATMIAEGLHAQHDLTEATQALIARVAADYRRPEVRDAGPLGFVYPTVDEHLPAALFPNWERAP